METLQKKCLARITADGEGHLVELSGDFFTSHPFASELGPTVVLTVKNERPTLADVAERLLKYDYDAPMADLLFDERGQLEIGRYLFEQLFAGLSSGERLRLANEKIDLQIETDDEPILRLPWNLLYAGRTFLTTAGWSVSYASLSAERSSVELEVSPRMLIAMPEPRGKGATGAAEHLAELESLLSAANRLHVCGQNLKVVESWNEFVVALDRFKPHLLYFYGHGEGDRNNSRLIFKDSNGQPLAVSAAELAVQIRKSDVRQLQTAYINCCYGDVGGLLGIGQQLGEFIPAVLTNSTVAVVEDAQKQALEIWRRILLDGAPPHLALNGMQKYLAGQPGSLRDVRWITPVLHRRYEEWFFKPPKPRNLEIDPGWEFTLNRSNQASRVNYELMQILRLDKLRGTAFIWHGCTGDGVKQFFKRLETDMENLLPDARILPVEIDFPPFFHELSEDVGVKFAEAFEVNDFAEVPDKIRSQARQRGGRQTIVFLQHPIISGGMELYNLSMLEKYLKWLDREFLDALGEHIFAFVGLGYEVRDPQMFIDKIEMHFDEVDFREMSFHVLERLPVIRYKDIGDFLHKHKIYLEEDSKKRILGRILEKSEGAYELVIEELRTLRKAGTRRFLAENNLELVIEQEF